MHPYRWLCGSDPTTYWCQAFAPAYLSGWAQAAVGLLALVGVGLGFVLTRRTLNEMRTQTKTLRDQMVLTDRAWLKVSAIVTGTIKRRPGLDYEVLSVTVRAEIENVGRSTAIDVDGSVMVFPIPASGNTSNDQADNLRQVIASARHVATTTKGLSRTLLPGDTTTFELTVCPPFREFQAQQFESEKEGPSVALYMLGCVTYRLPNDDTVRVSTYGYDIERIVAGGGGDWYTAHHFPLEQLKGAAGGKVSAIARLFKAD